MVNFNAHEELFFILEAYKDNESKLAATGKLPLTCQISTTLAINPSSVKYFIAQDHNVNDYLTVVHFKQGGLKIINFRVFVKAQRIMWIKRL